MKAQFSGIYLAIAALLCVAILLGSCVVVSTPAPSVPPATATSVPAVGMANPASVFCKEKGGQLKIEKDATGGEFGTCVFPDGSQCEEWAFYRGECKPGKLPAASAAETAIQLPDGSQCLFAGKGATLAFDGKRLNYTCGKTAGGEEIGLLGDLERKGTTLTVEKVIVGHNDKGFFVKESQKVAMEITQVDLADGTQCLHAGKGATLAFDGKRLNYTCKVAGTDQVGLIGDFTEKEGVWSAERATIVRKEGTFVLGESAVVPIKAVVGSSPTAAPAANELTGIAWVWQGLLMNNDTSKVPSDPSLYTLAFLPDGKVSIKADCNMAGGAYKVEGKKISFGPLATTLAACAPGSLYDEYLKRLGEVDSYLLQDGKLILLLKMDSGNMKFAPQAASAEKPATNYKDATYLIEGKPVTLVNGLSEIAAAPGSATKIVTRYFGNEAAGDLNGDGKPDVAFLLTQDPGGSGTFFYVVAALRTETGYLGTNAVLLGDRIAPQPTTIKDGMIIVNYADRKAGESFTTAPSMGVSKYLKIMDGKLVIVTPGSTATQPITSVTGSVSYLPRIALAPNAVIEVSLLDVSKADAPATVVVSQTIQAAGKQVPFPFELKFDPAKIDPKATYAVRATITVDGKLAWTSTKSFRVLTQGAPAKVEVIVEQAAQSGAALDLTKIEFDPKTFRCSNEPQRTMTDKQWQMYGTVEGSQPNQPGKPGQPVKVGLRIKFGEASDAYEVITSVIAPDGSSTIAKTTIQADKWAEQIYPTAFTGAKPTAPGIYTITWQVKGGFVACYGFEMAAQ